MRNFITLVLFVMLFATYSCGDDENIILPEEGKEIYLKTDSIFQYRFGSSMKEVNPDVIRSSNLAFSYGNHHNFEPGTVFRFSNECLMSVSKYYPSEKQWSYTHHFRNDLKALNPPVEIEFIGYANTVEEDEYEDWMDKGVVYLKKDSIQWAYNHLNVLIHNDYFSFDEMNKEVKGYYLAIEYKKID